MRLLLDTHALLWWLADDAQLGVQARGLIADPGNDILVSVASLWEIVVKSRVGKLRADFREISWAIDRDGFSNLPVSDAHLAALEKLSDEFREIIVLHDLEGLAYKEIAAVVGIPIGTVMSRLARARGRLRAEIVSANARELRS